MAKQVYTGGIRAQRQVFQDNLEASPVCLDRQEDLGAI